MTEYANKIGDRCQREKDDTIQVGVVTAIETEEVERTRSNYNYGYGDRRRIENYTETVIKNLTVKWDDGTEETVGPYDVHAEDSEIEREFRLAVNSAHEEIYKHVQEANDALDRAVAAAEKHGIPFSTGISFLSQTYVPTTFSSKYPDVDSSFAAEIADAYSEYGYDGGGWEHSAVC